MIVAHCESANDDSTLYAGAGNFYLIAFAIIKVAVDFAQELLVKRTLLKLAGDYDNRALTMQALYQDVKLGVFSPQILAGPDGQHAHLLESNKSPSPPEVPVFSYHELLNTCVASEQVSPSPCLPALAYPELFNRCISRENRVSGASAAGATSESSFLSSLSYPYNESGADDRHLAEGMSDVWKWTSCSYGRDRALVLLAQTPDGPARRPALPGLPDSAGGRHRTADEAPVPGYPRYRRTRPAPRGSRGSR